MNCKNRVWTHAARVAMYREVINEFGRFDRETWMFNPKGEPFMLGRKPNWVSYGECHETYSLIHRKLVENHNAKFPKTPKSGGAILNQVAWCTSLQSTNGDTGYFGKTRMLNRLAAIDAGFMSIDDVRWLIEQER